MRTTGPFASGAAATIGSIVAEGPLVILASGAVGAIGTAIGAYVFRLAAIGADVDRHDRRARALDEVLERWVMDGHRRLEAELKNLVEDHNARNALYSGHALADVAEARTRALQRYRDRLSESERALFDMLAEEFWLHSAYRWLRRSALELRAPRCVDAVVDRWRADAEIAGMADAARVYDPTRVSLEDFVASLRD